MYVWLTIEGLGRTKNQHSATGMYWKGELFLVSCGKDRSTCIHKLYYETRFCNLVVLVPVRLDEPDTYLIIAEAYLTIKINQILPI